MLKCFLICIVQRLILKAVLLKILIKNTSNKQYIRKCQYNYTEKDGERVVYYKNTTSIQEIRDRYLAVDRRYRKEPKIRICF